MNLNIIKDILFGVATGDALGVAVEFNDREVLRANPVTERQWRLAVLLMPDRDLRQVLSGVN